MARGAMAILSTPNLIHNINTIRALCPKQKIIAMVKANAYGHGLRSVAQRLQNHVDSLGVASIEEALALRESGIKTSITLMEGVFSKEEIILASTHCFTVVFHDHRQLNWLEQSSINIPLQVWVKIDTGMGRLGFSIEECDTILNKFAKMQDRVQQPVGIMSHFACADEPEHALNSTQHDRFKKCIQFFQGPKSFANSAAIFSSPPTHYDYIRPGLTIYGISPFKNSIGEDLGLKPVMTLASSIITIRNAPKGSSVGYGCTYICPQDSKIAVVAMGYGDGFPRNAMINTPVLVNNVICPLVGRVSMDMLTIDVTNAGQEIKAGDQVIFWGPQLPIEKIANHTQHICYDLITGIQQRVKYYWVN